MRKYRSGTNWCLWRWTTVDSEYITRLHLVKTPWWSVCVHWINKPDPEPYHHDHPVSFLSVVLRGEYTDECVDDDWWDGMRPSAGRRHWFSRNRFLHWIPARDTWSHTIREVKPGTITLCFMGKKTREWGFHTPTGWVYWKDYYKNKAK